MHYLVYSIFAQAYGEGAYGESTYQNGTTSSSSSTVTSTSGSSGLLTDTGLTILVIATIACALIFVALLVRFWRRPSKTSGTN